MFEIPKDLKYWYAISCPTTGIRFDVRTLQLLDSDGDGRIRSEELQAALAFLEKKGVTVETLFNPDPADEKALAENLAKQSDLAKLTPSAAEKQALADWEKAGKEPAVAVLGDKTAEAEAALGAVEKTIDAFFTPPEDMPLVTEAPDPELPLGDHLNPKHLEAILAFAEKCVRPIAGDKSTLSRLDYKKIKQAFAPYRAWVAAKPVMNATAKDALVEEERLLRYRLHLGEFLANYVTMDRLYEGKKPAIYQMGVLRIDGKEMDLCFHVESEAAHSALVGISKCCVIYLKLTRPADKAERLICAVVTAGQIAGLYVGRNGVFYDRDGKNWEAVVTKVVEAQVSLAEAFWAPWRKLGESISSMVKKFFGEKQAKSTAMVSTPTTLTAAPAKEGGAAMASSVAAIGIGVGMIGAAAASIMAAVSHMSPLQILGSVISLILVVSLPSVILTWFNLRRRDLAAILNACGWAVNRPMHFSMKRASSFTKCAKGSPVLLVLLILLVLALVVSGGAMFMRSRAAAKSAQEPAKTEACAKACANECVQSTVTENNNNTNEVENVQN